MAHSAEYGDNEKRFGVVRWPFFLGAGRMSRARGRGIDSFWAVGMLDWKGASFGGSRESSQKKKKKLPMKEAKKRKGQER
jgi:hypothetical protein